MYCKITKMNLYSFRNIKICGLSFVVKIEDRVFAISKQDDISRHLLQLP